MVNIIRIDKDIMGGTPVFNGTRVPIQTFFDYVEGEQTIEEFLQDFPTVKKDQVIALLEQLKAQALKNIPSAA